MNRFTIVCLLTLFAAAAFAADSNKNNGFMPLTPEGYPVGTSNPPAPAASLPMTLSATPRTITSNVSASTDAAEASGVLLDDRHKLVAGDKLSFLILEDRHLPNLDNSRTAPTPVDLSKSLTVGDTGELDVPYVGRVNVAGKTCKDVAADLKALLEKDYYYRATVVLGLDQMSRVLGRVYVWGEVRNQGPIEIPVNENLTASKAILRAGGFNDWARKTKVKIIQIGRAHV